MTKTRRAWINWTSWLKKISKFEIRSRVMCPLLVQVRPSQILLLFCLPSLAAEKPSFLRSFSRDQPRNALKNKPAAPAWTPTTKLVSPSSLKTMRRGLRLAIQFWQKFSRYYQQNHKVAVTMSVLCRRRTKISKHSQRNLRRDSR